jgi:hypothetical protein
MESRRKNTHFECGIAAGRLIAPHRASGYNGAGLPAGMKGQ